jgi:hypothetical protein
MKLDLRFTARPLEDLWCDTVVAFVFQEHYTQENGISGLDVKTSGGLTRLLKNGFWTGADGETLLIASENMIKADKILLKGLGAPSGYSTENLSVRIRELANALGRMSINDFAIRIPVTEESESEYCSYIESACTDLVDSFLAQHEDDDDFFLKILVSLEDTFVQGLEKTIRQLKEHFMSKLDYSIIIDRTNKN